MNFKTVIFAGLLLSTLTASAESRLIAVNSYAAAVNDRVITDGEVQLAVEPMLRRLQQKMRPEELQSQMPKIFQSALNQLVDRALILEEFEALGYQLPGKNVLQEEQNFVQKNFDGDRVRFEAYLRSEGQTMQEWRDELGEKVRIDMLRYREIFSRIDISPLEVRRAYEQRKSDFMEGEQATMRLIEIAHGADAEAARVKADDVAARAAAGEDFAELARNHSDGSRAASGGEMPKMDPNGLRPELKQAVRQLQAGEISPVIDAGAKFYIIKLEAYEPGRVRAFLEVRENIERELKGREAERLTKRWMERLHRKHTVQLF